MIEKSRAPRKVAIADHLWDVFEQMAEEMGADREALINQAMFMFARLNGFLTPGAGGAAAAEARAPVEPARPRVAPAPDPEPDDDLGPESDLSDDTPLPSPSKGGGAAAAAAAVGAAAGGDESRRRQVEERVLETAAQLERQIKGRAEKTPDPPLPPDDDLDDDIDDDEIVDELMGEAQKKSLYLMTSEGELDKVTKERFLIGRGKHCDFVVQSGKVSREHAVISKEDDGYFIEDLGSSNGTWFQKKRIKRRQIEDGDEFYICSEKIKCVIR
jgi:hypothetical protein